MPNRLQKIVPLVIAAVLIVIDQITKAAVAAQIPLHGVAWTFGGDFFHLIHERNTGVAFSMGDGLPTQLRQIFFILVPVAVLGLLGVFYWRDKSISLFQRWGLALILAGGIGNIVDRVFRPDGVVDFLSFQFYGLFGLDRFPTFNVADSCVCVGGALVVLSFLIRRKAK